MHSCPNYEPPHPAPRTLLLHTLVAPAGRRPVRKWGAPSEGLIISVWAGLSPIEECVVVASSYECLSLLGRCAQSSPRGDDGEFTERCEIEASSSAQAEAEAEPLELAAVSDGVADGALGT
jgi:hypothetical protein